LRLRRRSRLRVHQSDRFGDKPGGFSSAGDLQDTLVVGLHDVLIAYPDNRIIFHWQSPSCPSPTGYANMSRIVPRKKLQKITKGWLVYRALTGMNGKTGFAMTATASAV
jgi:hypothetical protein